MTRDDVIQAMAEAHWADSENTAWGNLLPEDQAHMVKVMRATVETVEALGVRLAPVELHWDQAYILYKLNDPGLDEARMAYAKLLKASPLHPK